MLVRIAFTASSRVAIESQPDALIKVSLNVPAVVKVLPFQLYGS